MDARRADRTRLAKTAAAALDQAWFRPASEQVGSAGVGLADWDGTPEGAREQLARWAGIFDDQLALVLADGTVTSPGPPPHPPSDSPPVRAALAGPGPVVVGLAVDS